MPGRSVHGLVLLLLLATLALQLPSFDEPFGSDLGERAYGAWLVLEGHPIYTDFHPGHHLPAAFYTFALAFRLFGFSYFALKVWIGLTVVLEAALVYALGNRLWGARVGVVAAYLFALFSSDPFMEATTGEIELVANLPRIASVLLLWLAIQRPQRRQRWWLLLVSGAATCMACWFKASYILGLGPTVVLVALATVRQEGPLRQKVVRLVDQYLAVACGMLVVALPVVAYLAVVGALPGLVQVFSMGVSYIEGRGAASPGLAGVLIVPVAKVALELWFPLSLVLFAVLAWVRKRRLLDWAPLLACLWILFAFAEANVSLYPFRHYDLLMVPAVALAAASGLAQLGNVGRSRFSVDRLAAALLIVAAPVSIYLRTYRGYSVRAYLSSFAAYRLGWISRTEYLLRAMGTDGLVPLQTEAAGAYVRDHTSPSDRVYMWSDQMNFYFVARRKCAIRYIWPVQVGVNLAYVPAMAVPGGWESLRAMIFATPAKYIAVFVPATVPEWLAHGLAAEYRLETTILGVQIYRWVGQP